MSSESGEDDANAGDAEDRQRREQEAQWSRDGGDAATDDEPTDSEPTDGEPTDGEPTEAPTEQFDPNAFPPPTAKAGESDREAPDDEVPPASETSTQQFEPMVAPTRDDPGGGDEEVVREEVVERPRERVVEEPREVVVEQVTGGLRAPAVAPQRETPWWLWLVGALVLLALAVVVVLVASDDEPDLVLGSEAPSLQPSELVSDLPTEDPSLDPSELESELEDGTVSNSDESPLPGASATAGEESDEDGATEEPVLDGTDLEELPGTVLVGSTSILPLPPEGLTPFRGRTVQVTQAVVQQVVGSTGFWIGPSNSIRLFVLSDAGDGGTIDDGDLVTFDGEVVANDGDLGTYGIDPATGEALLEEQGSHLEVKSSAIEVEPFSQG